jgi:hypothetical protein
MVSLPNLNACLRTRVYVLGFDENIGGTCRAVDLRQGVGQHTHRLSVYVNTAQEEWQHENEHTRIKTHRENTNKIHAAQQELKEAVNTKYNPVSGE